jgi:uracil-DNA glycosylase
MDYLCIIFYNGLCATLDIFDFGPAESQSSEMDVRIEPGWKQALQEEFGQPYFSKLAETLKQELAAGQTLYPPGPLIFNAFAQTPFHKVRVVILGQDPYHNPGQANGLSFSVPSGIPPPPSLRNIYEEINRSLDITMPRGLGDLSSWAQQGVLLLNAILTVRANSPSSHSTIGWANFTDAVIRKLSSEKKGIIFLLWGRFAGEKTKLIDSSKHHILTAPHPSPLSAYRGFIGCGHFVRVNELLQADGQEAIDWRLS